MFAIVDEIKSKVDRETIFIDLYKNAFPGVARYISKRGGTLADAKDVFQDAVIIYYEKFVVRDEILQSSSSAYIMGISKHLWSKKFQEQTKLTNLESFPTEEEKMTIECEVPVKEKVLFFLGTAGKKCMEILTAFYYENSSLDEIAKSFGFSGTRSATVQKYKCLEKVRDEIKNKSLNYEDFTE